MLVDLRELLRQDSARCGTGRGATQESCTEKAGVAQSQLNGSYVVVSWAVGFISILQYVKSDKGQKQGRRPRHLAMYYNRTCRQITVVTGVAVAAASAAEFVKEN